MKPLALFVLLAAALLAACASTPERAPGVDALLGTTWRCTSIEGVAAYGPQLSFEVDEEGRISGHSGLNRWFGGEVNPDGSLTLEPLGMTRMAGPEDLMDQESRYVTALGRASRFRIDGDRLELLDGEAVVSTFAARP